MISPSPHTRSDIIERDFTALVCVEQTTQLPEIIYPFAAFQAAMLRENDKPQERKSLCHCSGMRTWTK